MEKCKVCGKPIIRFKNDIDIFEGMHWICFHMMFEHDGFDPDEPCNDPSCPWNQISGEAIHIINHYAELKFLSEDKVSGIFLKRKSIEGYRLPGVELQIVLVDDMVKDYSDTIWISKCELESFISGLKEIFEKGKGQAKLSSMSPEELQIVISNIDSRGHIILEFKVKKSKHFRNRIREISYSNSFEMEFNSIDKIIKKTTVLIEEINEKIQNNG